VAGITRATPNPPGGLIGHNANGDLDGMLEGSAVYRVAAVIPPLSTEQQLEDLGRATTQLASTGLGIVRDPITLREHVELYEVARKRDALKVRCRLMLLITPTRSAKEAIERLEDYAELRSNGDDLLRVWGIKLVMDGGAEGGALDAPYANDPAFRGHLN